MRSCARQRFVAASSRRTDENVASRRGSGRHCRRASRARALSLSLRRVSHESRNNGVGILPEKAAYNVLEKAGGLLLHKLGHHVAENGTNSVEPFVCSADVVKTMIVKKDLLDNEYSNRLAKLRTRLHDSETKRDDFSCQEEVDDIGGIVLDKGTNNSKRRQSQIFERSRFRGSVQEGIEEEWDVRYNSQ
jgi:hypothetical protein